MSVPNRPPYGSRPGEAALLAGAPLRLGHLVPERRPVVISRPNPEWLALDPEDPKRVTLPDMVDVILQGYAVGPTCPGVVKAELASVNESYMRSMQDAETGGMNQQISPGIFLTAWHTYVRETIQALVPGLSTGEADVLAALAPGEEGAGADLLRYLGFWEAAPNPEVQSGPGPDSPTPPEPRPITASSSPILPPSTASDPLSF